MHAVQNSKPKYMLSIRREVLYFLYSRSLGVMWKVKQCSLSTHQLYSSFTNSIKFHKDSLRVYQNFSKAFCPWSWNLLFSQNYHSWKLNTVGNGQWFVFHLNNYNSSGHINFWLFMIFYHFFKNVWENGEW